MGETLIKRMAQTRHGYSMKIRKLDITTFYIRSNISTALVFRAKIFMKSFKSHFTREVHKSITNFPNYHLN